MYLVFRRMSVESPTYCRRFRSLLLCLCFVFRALIITPLYGGIDEVCCL